MEGIPTFFGDILYAIMIYFGVRFLFIHKGFTKTIALALAICFCIEFFQLYRAEWILNIRSTTLGHYVLGQGFLWSDLGFYTIGILIAVLVDFNLVRKTKDSTLF